VTRNDGHSGPSCRPTGGLKLQVAGLGLERHLSRHPQTNAASDESEPYHQVGLFGAVKLRHCFTKETWMDEKGRNTCDRMMLQNGLC
jgi:hypothetical protein